MTEKHYIAQTVTVKSKLSKTIHSAISSFSVRPLCCSVQKHSIKYHSQLDVLFFLSFVQCEMSFFCSQARTLQTVISKKDRMGIPVFQQAKISVTQGFYISQNCKVLVKIMAKHLFVFVHLCPLQP